jgi:hypothetical protein
MKLDTLPPGYSLQRRTREEGGGWVLIGGVKRVPAHHKDQSYMMVSGGRRVAAWDGDLDREEIEDIARLDYLSKHSITDDERSYYARQFVLRVSQQPTSRVGMPKEGGKSKAVKELRSKREYVKGTWDERG